MTDNQFMSDPAIIQEFVGEFREYIQAMERNIPQLQQTPGDLELLDEVIRPVHTLKGATGFLGFMTMNELSRKLESSLKKCRDRGGISPEMASLLPPCLEAIKKFIDEISEGKDGSTVEVTALVARIDDLPNG